MKRARLFLLVGILSACAVLSSPISHFPAHSIPCTRWKSADTQKSTSNDITKGVVERRNTAETAAQHPLRDRTRAVSVTGLLGGSLAFLSVILRLCARKVVGSYGMDDWIMVSAMGLVIPLSVLSIILADDGLGKDIWTVSSDRLTHILYIYYIDEILYLGSLMMIRLSVLCFYLRIFPQKMFRRIAYAVMLCNALYSSAFILVSIFQCVPIHAAWQRLDDTAQVSCVNVNAFGWASAAANIILDLVILLLPLPGLARLAMSWQRKARIFVVFGLGFFVIAVSSLRLTSLVRFANTRNITWDYVPVGYWSTIEVHTSVICACLPAIPPLFRMKSESHLSRSGAAEQVVVRRPRTIASDNLPLLKVTVTHV